MKLSWKVIIPAILAVIILLRLFAGEICTVSSVSMEPAIRAGDRLWMDKLTYGAPLPRRFADIPLLNVFTWIKPLRLADQKNDWGNNRLRGLRMPRRGDLAVFISPEPPHPLLVKRIAARFRTGDTIVIRADNYEELSPVAVTEGNDIYIRNDSIFINGRPDSTCVLSQPYYYMLGDNRKNSHDSRQFGYIPYSAVVGRMNFVFFSVNTNRRFIGMIRRNRFFKPIK